MNGTKTEWRAEQGHKFWRVVKLINGVVVQVMAEFLDKPTAHRIAAVNELEAALQDCLDDLADRNHCKGYSSATAALAKARGEQ